MCGKYTSPLKFYRAQFSDTFIPLKFCRAQFSDTFSPLKLCRAQFSDTFIPLKFYRAQFSDTFIPLKFYRAQFSDAFIPLKFYRAQFSDAFIPLKFYRAQFSETFIPLKFFRAQFSDTLHRAGWDSNNALPVLDFRKCSVRASPKTQFFVLQHLQSNGWDGAPAGHTAFSLNHPTQCSRNLEHYKIPPQRLPLRIDSSHVYAQLHPRLRLKNKSSCVFRFLMAQL
jgi:hypothetical protein